MPTYDELMAMSKAELLKRVHAEGVTWATMQWAKDDLARQLIREEARRAEAAWYDKHASKTV